MKNELQEYVESEIKTILPDYDDDLLTELKLEPLEILFVYKYVSNNFDGLAAYKEVYGVDQKQALPRYKKLLSNEKIKSGIDKLLDMIWDEACSVLPVQLLQDLNELRNLDIFDYYFSDGSPRPLDSISPAKRKMINNVNMMLDRDGGVHITYDLPDKRKTTSTMLEIIKLRSETTKDKEGNINDMETREMIDSIFSKAPAKVLT